MFSCPDCLVSSPSAHDIANKYCFRCHEFKDHGLELTTFQIAVGKVLWSGDPEYALGRVIARFRMMLMPVAGMYVELIALQSASRLAQDQRTALYAWISKLATSVDTILSSPKNPIE